MNIELRDGEKGKQWIRTELEHAQAETRRLRTEMGDTQRSLDGEAVARVSAEIVQEWLQGVVELRVRLIVKLEGNPNG